MEDKKMSAADRSFKQILIDPKFQWSIIAYSTTLAIILQATLFVALRLFFSKYNEEGKTIHLAPDHPFFVFIQDQQTYMNYVFAVVCIIFLILNVIFGLIISHRVAGPLYRLKKYFREYHEQNEFTELTFRKKDFFQDVPAIINESLKKNIQKKEAKN
jgi:magnesium-transporting ATPase (P-type)